VGIETGRGDEIGVTVENIIGKHVTEVPTFTEHAQQYSQEDLAVLDTSRSYAFRKKK